MKIKRIFVIMFVIIVCVPWAGVPSEGDINADRPNLTEKLKYEYLISIEFVVKLSE